MSLTEMCTSSYEKEAYVQGGQNHGRRCTCEVVRAIVGGGMVIARGGVAE